MKRSGTIIAAMTLGVSLACAQIPNAGFEDWTNGTPDNWITSNSVVGTTIMESNVAHSGSHAAEGLVISYYTVVITPLLQTGTEGRGFAYAGRPGFLTGYYQLSTTTGDQISVSGLLTKGGTSGTGIAAAAGVISTPASSYTQFSIPFYYATSDVPDTAYVQFSMVGSTGSPSTSSTFLVDDIAFSGTSAVDASLAYPKSFTLSQNYPNPFNPTTNIQYTVAGTGGQGQGFTNVKLAVYDVLGREVAVLVNGQKPPGTYDVKFDATRFPSGMYIYRLTAGSFSATRTMTLVK